MAANSSSESTAIAGPSTARLVWSISSPSTAEIPDPPARRGADLPGDRVLRAFLADPPRRDRDEGGEHAGERPAENDERHDGRGGFRLPPDKPAGADGDEQAGPITVCAGTCLAGRARPILTAVSAPQ